MFMSIGLWAQEAVSTHVIVVWDRYMQVLYVGRALRTKETLPDFLKWCRVTRHPPVFCGLTGSQRTPGLGRYSKCGVAGRFFVTRKGVCQVGIIVVLGDSSPVFRAFFTVFPIELFFFYNDFSIATYIVFLILACIKY